MKHVKPMKLMARKGKKNMSGGKSVHNMMGTDKMCSGTEGSMPKKDMKG